MSNNHYLATAATTITSDNNWQQLQQQLQATIK